MDARAAETMLRVAGRTVLLRLPVAAVAGDEAEQIGLGDAQWQDVELGPCVWRKTGSRAELLVSAVAVARVVGSLAYDSAAVLFRLAAGVVVEGGVLPVEGMVPVEAGGAVVVYRVRLGE